VVPLGRPIQQVQIVVVLNVKGRQASYREAWGSKNARAADALYFSFVQLLGIRNQPFLVIVSEIVLWKVLLARTLQERALGEPVGCLPSTAEEIGADGRWWQQVSIDIGHLSSMSVWISLSLSLSL